MLNFLVYSFVLFLCFDLKLGSVPVVKDREIVVSIKPIHSLVCALTKGMTNPRLLVDGNFSPHNFQIMPSQAMTIKNAKYIIWIGPSYAKPLHMHLQNFKGKVLCLQDSKLIKFKAISTGTFWDEHSNCCHHDHEVNQMSLDGHIWLDPNIMLQVVDVVLEFLIKNYPEYTNLLEANAAAYRVRLKKLHTDLSLKMLPYKGKTYIISHDGNQYFDDAFGAKTIATISIDPSVPPCAGHMLKLRRAVLDGEINPVCLFSELQMDGVLAENYAKILNIRCALLDYLGTHIPSGEYAYEEIMNAYVTSFIEGMEASA
jgi:zinc transport system substrate-binding protein